MNLELIVIPKKENGRRETDRAVTVNGTAIMVKEFSPFTLWKAACEAFGLEDISSGFGYNGYCFSARDPETGEILFEEYVGE